VACISESHLQKSKGKEMKNWSGNFTHLWEKRGGVIVTKICTRVYLGYVMISVDFGVDISRDKDSVGG
jgi:hypothetical protein